MYNQKFPFHIKSAILLVGLCSCALEESTDPVGERLELEENEVVEPADEHPGSGEINSHEAEAIPVSTETLRGDFNGDNYADLAVGVTGEEFDGVTSGAVVVFYGTDEGLSTKGDKVFHRDTAGVKGAPEPGDEFGRVLAVGNFNDDEYADLAIGVPFDDDEAQDAGSVTVLYGSSEGLSTDNSETWDQDSPGIEDDADKGDNFGYALTTGDFNGDYYDDLAIGVPGEDVSDEDDAGLVHVIYGTGKGLDAEGSQIWHQGIEGVTGLLEENDRFGTTLAAGDFDDDDSDDLVIGVPDEDVGDIEDAGWIHVLYGSDSSRGSVPGVFTGGGLTTVREEVWHQDISGVEDSTEDSDQFGFAFAVGDFDNDMYDDLAIGVPGEEVSSEDRAGAVNVIYGAGDGLDVTDDQFWHQDQPDIEGEVDENEYFGRALAAGDFDLDHHDDLAIGVPGDDYRNYDAAGKVQVLYGEDDDGLTGDRDERWHQSIAGIEGIAEKDDQFGYALSTGDFDGEGTADLVIGVPFEDVGDKTDAGAINVIYGDDNEGLSNERDVYLHQDAKGVEGLAEEDDLFGFAVR
jgi:FG-GAP repeat